jgi:tRNA threonylcarbamoyladenosine biosynthesis protein TsaB
VIVLAVDAATDRLSVAAGSPAGGRTAVRVAEGARRHAGLLVPYALECLDELGLGVDAVEAVAVSDGPGSFTGLRVAAAWAKALAGVRGIPLWTASSLLVRAASRGRTGELVLGTGAALRGEWFVGGYRWNPGGAIETVLPPSVMASSSAPPERPAVVIGDRSAEAVGAWAGCPVVVGPPAGWPDAAALIRLIGPAGGAVRVADPAGWEPTYGRPAEAQAKWERDHGRALPNPAGNGL